MRQGMTMPQRERSESCGRASPRCPRQTSPRIAARRSSSAAACAPVGTRTRRPPRSPPFRAAPRGRLRHRRPPGEPCSHPPRLPCAWGSSGCSPSRPRPLERGPADNGARARVWIPTSSQPITRNTIRSMLIRETCVALLARRRGRRSVGSGRYRREAARLGHLAGSHCTRNLHAVVLLLAHGGTRPRQRGGGQGPETYEWARSVPGRQEAITASPWVAIAPFEPFGSESCSIKCSHRCQAGRSRVRQSDQPGASAGVRWRQSHSFAWQKAVRRRQRTQDQGEAAFSPLADSRPVDLPARQDGSEEEEEGRGGPQALLLLLRPVRSFQTRFLRASRASGRRTALANCIWLVASRWGAGEPQETRRPSFLPLQGVRGRAGAAHAPEEPAFQVRGVQQEAAFGGRVAGSLQKCPPGECAPSAAPAPAPGVRRPSYGFVDCQTPDLAQLRRRWTWSRSPRPSSGATRSTSRWWA